VCSAFSSSYQCALLQRKALVVLCLAEYWRVTDEGEVTEDQEKRVRVLLPATAEGLAQATESDLEIEGQLKGKDSTLLGTPVAGKLREAVAPTVAAVPSGSGAVEMQD